MTNYKRSGAKWTVNECLRLQREYELLKLSIDEIATLHQRSAQAIMYKLDAEGIADYNVLAVCGTNTQLRRGSVNINEAYDVDDDSSSDYDYDENENDKNDDDDNDNDNDDAASEISDVEDDNDSSSDYEDKHMSYSKRHIIDEEDEDIDKDVDEDCSESSSDSEYDRFNISQQVKILSKQLSALSAIVVKWVNPNDAKNILKFDDVKTMSKQVSYLADLVTKFVKSRGSSESRDILKFEDLAGCR